MLNAQAGWLLEKKRSYLWNYHIITTAWENRILAIKIWFTHSSFLFIENYFIYIRRYIWNKIMNIQIPAISNLQIFARGPWGLLILLNFRNKTSQIPLKSLCPFLWVHVLLMPFSGWRQPLPRFCVYSSSMCFYTMTIYVHTYKQRVLVCMFSSWI